MKVLASLAAILTLATAGAASAQEARVRYGDLDLSSPAGAAAFDRRARDEGRRVCRAEAPGLVDLGCLRRVRAGAVDGLPEQQRTDYASARNETLYASTRRAPGA